jgi:hypothetical protein
VTGGVVTGGVVTGGVVTGGVVTGGVVTGGVVTGGLVRADGGALWTGSNGVAARRVTRGAVPAMPAMPGWTWPLSRLARAASTAACIRLSKASGSTGRVVDLGPHLAAPGTRRVSGGFRLSSAIWLTPGVAPIEPPPERPDEHMRAASSTAMTLCHGINTFCV